MSAIDRILGETKEKIRPPTQAEKTDPAEAYWYAKLRLEGRWPEGEALIAKYPRWSYYYAQDVVKGRWPEGEVAISKDPYWAYYYALDIVEGEWTEGEAAIASKSKWAFLYADSIIKSRFPEGEATIANSEWKETYLERFPEAKEDWIINGWLDWLDT
jgi:hypothetical protein